MEVAVAVAVVVVAVVEGRRPHGQRGGAKAKANQLGETLWQRNRKNETKRNGT